MRLAMTKVLYAAILCAVANAAWAQSPSAESEGAGMQDVFREVYGRIDAGCRLSAPKCRLSAPRCRRSAGIWRGSTIRRRSRR